MHDTDQIPDTILLLENEPETPPVHSAKSRVEPGIMVFHHDVVRLHLGDVVDQVPVSECPVEGYTSRVGEVLVVDVTEVILAKRHPDGSVVCINIRRPSVVRGISRSHRENECTGLGRWLLRTCPLPHRPTEGRPVATRSVARDGRFWRGVRVTRGFIPAAPSPDTAPPRPRAPSRPTPLPPDPRSSAPREECGSVRAR